MGKGYDSVATNTIFLQEAFQRRTSGTTVRPNQHVVSYGDTQINLHTRKSNHPGYRSDQAGRTKKKAVYHVFRGI